jgi:hypothetical protein
MRRTHKLRQLKQDEIVQVLAGAPTVAAAAKALGVSRDSMHRWIREGRAPRPGGGVKASVLALATTSRRRSPAAWTRAVRQRYELTVTEEALVDMAAEAMRLAQDQKVGPEVRLRAVARFQAVIRQLNFEVPDGEVEKTPGTVRPWPRTAGS